LYKAFHFISYKLPSTELEVAWDCRLFFKLKTSRCNH